MEIETSDIQDFLGRDANLKDLEDYVNIQLGQQSPKSRRNKKGNGEVFQLDRSEYIAFLVTQRENRLKELKRHSARQKINNALLWILKMLAAAFILCFVCYGFYLTGWFVQNSLYFYMQNLPVRP